MNLYKKIIKKLFYNAFPEYREKELFIKQVEKKVKKTEQTINTNQNPCINCCVKYSCKGICEKRYLWNLKIEGAEE